MQYKTQNAIIFIFIQIITYGHLTTQEHESDYFLSHDYEDLPKNRQMRESTCLHWTPWFSADIPSHDGDYETLSSPDDMGVPGTIHQLHLSKLDRVCTLPVSIECRVHPENISWTETYDELAISCQREYGLICRTQDQPYQRRCRDYEVRFLCWNECPSLHWSGWIDNDDPDDGEGDIEILGDTIQRHEWPCSGGEMPVDVECETITGIPIHQSKKRGLECNSLGFSCLNSMQPKKSCNCDDFRVRFLCPQRKSFPGGYRTAKYY